jgi:hypothetical protein
MWLGRYFISSFVVFCLQDALQTLQLLRGSETTSSLMLTAGVEKGRGFADSRTKKKEELQRQKIFFV